MFRAHSYYSHADNKPFFFERPFLPRSAAWNFVAAACAAAVPAATADPRDHKRCSVLDVLDRMCYRVLHNRGGILYYLRGLLAPAARPCPPHPLPH